MSYPAESWITTAEADAYFLYKWNASVLWNGLTSPEKEQLLVSAYRWINQLYTLSITSVTDKVKNAQCETAWYIYKFWDLKIYLQDTQKEI